MIKQHLILGILWMTYCFIHSLLADNHIKSFFLKLMRKRFKYYRILYSIFAAITLVTLLYFQFSISSVKIIHSTILQITSIFLFALPGLVIMGICIRKYFYELSGIQVLNDEPLHITLQQKGLHKYVRHPLYAGTLLFVWGLFLCMPLLSNLMTSTILTIYTLIGIKLEERKLVMEFGLEYVDYSKKVSMLIPGIF